MTKEKSVTMQLVCAHLEISCYLKKKNEIGIKISIK